MAVSRSDMSESVDYADFDYDQFTLTTSQDNTGNGTVVAEFDPLAQQGGLRPNQVAEIAYIELDISGTAFEGTGTSNFEDTIEQRGVFGINLNEDDDSSSQSNGVDAENVEVVSGSFINTETAALNEPGVLIPYRVTDTAGKLYNRSWRDLTGRGPVVDANDNLTFVHTSIVEGDVATDFSAQAHVVYDIFEIDDARTEFSVPTDD